LMYSCVICWYVSALWIYGCRLTVHLFLSVSLLYYCIICFSLLFLWVLIWH